MGNLLPNPFCFAFSVNLLTSSQGVSTRGLSSRLMGRSMSGRCFANLLTILTSSSMTSACSEESLDKLWEAVPLATLSNAMPGSLATRWMSSLILLGEMPQKGRMSWTTWSKSSMMGDLLSMANLNHSSNFGGGSLPP